MLLLVEDISTHAPTKGATVAVAEIALVAVDFNSRIRKGCDFVRIN